MEWYEWPLAKQSWPCQTARGNCIRTVDHIHRGGIQDMLRRSDVRISGRCFWWSPKRLSNRSISCLVYCCSAVNLFSRARSSACFARSTSTLSLIDSQVVGWSSNVGRPTFTEFRGENDSDNEAMCPSVLRFSVSCGRIAAWYQVDDNIDENRRSGVCLHQSDEEGRSVRCFSSEGWLQVYS